MLGVGDAGELAEEQIAGVAVDQRDVVVTAEQADDLLGLAHAQQAGVDKDAGEALADRLVDERRGDRGIDPAGEAADHAAAGYLVADALDRLGAERRHRPVAAAAADVVGEVLEQRRALRGVDDLGMEEAAVEASRVVGDRGIGRAVGRRGDPEPGGDRVDLVAVAHPHLGARAFRPQPVEQWAVGDDVDRGAAEFLGIGERHPAAKLGAHRLHAVADRQHRNAERKDDLGRARRRGLRDGGGAAREDDASGRKRADGVHAHRVGVDFAVDAVLAHPPRDQLGDLAAEIEDQDAVGHRAVLSMVSFRGAAPQRTRNL